MRPLSCRRANTATFATDLWATGQLRPDLTDNDVAEIVWSTYAREYYQLLAQQGWPPDRYALATHDLWTRLLLNQPPTCT